MKHANWDNWNDLQRIQAIRAELNLPTHNGTSKDELLRMLQYLWDVTGFSDQGEDDWDG